MFGREYVADGTYIPSTVKGTNNCTMLNSISDTITRKTDCKADEHCEWNDSDSMCGKKDPRWCCPQKDWERCGSGVIKQTG